MVSKQEEPQLPIINISDLLQQIHLIRQSEKYLSSLNTSS